MGKLGSVLGAVYGLVVAIDDDVAARRGGWAAVLSQLELEGLAVLPVRLEVVATNLRTANNQTRPLSTSSDETDGWLARTVRAPI